MALGHTNGAGNAASGPLASGACASGIQAYATGSGDRDGPQPQNQSPALPGKKNEW